MLANSMKPFHPLLFAPFPYILVYIIMITLYYKEFNGHFQYKPMFIFLQFHKMYSKSRDQDHKKNVCLSQKKKAAKATFYPVLNSVLYRL